MPAEIVMRVNRTWDVKCPPVKKHVVAGKLVPNVVAVFSGGLIRKKRRIAIEIHGPEKEEVKKLAAPVRRGLKRSNESDANVVNLGAELQDDDRIVIRIWKPRKAWGFSRDPDDSSDSESESEEAGGLREGSFKKKAEDGNWVEYRKFGLDEIHDEALEKLSWEATMGLGANQERREIRFETPEKAKDFHEEIRKLRELVKERATQRMEAFKKTSNARRESLHEAAKSLSMEFSSSSEVSLLVEIVSATDLPITDVTSTDPYIIVYMGKQEIHRTKPIRKSLNPIWTVDDGSLFIVSSTAEEFFSYECGLNFVIKDYDGLSSNETIAKLALGQADLLKMDGERTSFDLQVLKYNNFKAATDYFGPRLHLRVRKAQREDRAFMKKLHAIKQSKKLGIYADESFVAPKAERMGLLKKEKKILDGVKLYRVKPRPDPSRPEQDTKWMTTRIINEEAMKPTYKYIEAGTGSLGKLYLEVIKCDKLPNMDTGLDGKTDAFCCIIYEDAIVNTDVINDELSPRWLPWSQRGFVFRVLHPSSQVLLGVFDYDSAKGMNAHDAIGRVTIDVTNFRPNTEYLLTYDLYRSVLDNDRDTFGTITVRVRLEYDNYRDFVKGSLRIPPLNYINLPKKNDFHTSYFVCNGEENLQRFDMQAITSYRTELEGYLEIIYYITQAAVAVVLWRGHFEINSLGWKLPIHSMVAFLMGIFLVENFNLLPSFFFFSIAWLLLATNGYRQRNPSPWHATMTFMDMWYAVLASKAPHVEIAEFENEAAIRAYEKQEQIRKLELEEVGKEKAEAAAKLNAFLTEEVNAASQSIEEDHVTKVGGVPTVNPLAFALLPVQKILGQVCKILRIISSVFLWDESIYAFILVNACLVLGLALIWVPWHFIVRWTLRILVWVLLGPWMKLVDMFYVRKMRDGKATAAVFKEMAKAKLEAVGTARDVLMARKEELTKLRAMKRYMFGKYVTRVPRLKEYRFPDFPRPESTAIPIKSYRKPVNILAKSHGQTLVGDMIPVWGDAVDSEKLKKEEEKKKKEEEEE